MRNNVKIDYSAKAIVVTKSFLEEAKIYGTEEYKLLQSILKDCPDFRVVTKSVRSGKRKSDIKGLTYQYMRRFIALMDSKNLSTFNNVQIYYEMHEEDNATVYHYVKDWFLKNYPNHKEMIVDNCPQRVTENIPQHLLPEGV